MARRVLLTRPEAESRELADLLRARGIAGVLAPILAVQPVGGRIDDIGRFQAALATSGNGVDGLAAATPRRAISLFAVGAATAERARHHGFAPVVVAEGTGGALVDLVSKRLRPGDGALLWASGDEVRVDMVAELAGFGFQVVRAIVYRTVACDRLPEAAAAALAGGTVDAALFFSPRTAERFASLVIDAGLARRTAVMSAHCLSPAIADAARALPWAAIRTADKPTRDDLLATLDDTTTSDPD